jgi:3'-phosphoadenosine 5'-phosphosulfate sulfotransferase (PAPS reductase)/FAD synthetase
MLPQVLRRACAAEVWPPHTLLVVVLAGSPPEVGCLPCFAPAGSTAESEEKKNKEKKQEKLQPAREREQHNSGVFRSFLGLFK